MQLNTIQMGDIYTNLLKASLVDLFNKKSYFADLVQPLTLDDITFNEDAFIIKRPTTEVKLNQYNKDTDLGTSDYRYGKPNEHVWKDIKIPYQYQPSVNEALDTLKINENPTKALAVVALGVAQAFVEYIDERIAEAFIDNAHASSVTKTTNDVMDGADALTENRVTEKNRVLYASVSLNRAIATDPNYTVLEKGSSVNMDEFQPVGVFYGMEVRIIPSDILKGTDGKLVAGFIAIKNSALRGVGVDETRVIESEKFKGYLVQSVQRGLVHVDKTIYKTIFVIGKEAGEGLSATKEKTIEEMTVKELEAYATEKGYDLAGATKKDDIIAKIKELEA